MASATPLSSASGSGGLPADVAALFETFAGKPQAPIKFYEYALASVQMRVKAVRDAESSPGGSSSNALDVTTAERARAPPQPLLMVAKCSVMVGGHQVSSRRLLGRPGPKSGSAGSRWRPQHTRKSRAARAMAPVLQDKPRHSTDLAELCSLILWSTLYTFWARVRAKGARSVEYWWEDPRGAFLLRLSLLVLVFGRLVHLLQVSFGASSGASFFGAWAASAEVFWRLCRSSNSRLPRESCAPARGGRRTRVPRAFLLCCCSCRSLGRSLVR